MASPIIGDCDPASIDEEVWVRSPSFPDYEVSSEGRVRRLTTRTSTRAGRILRACLHYRGYYHHGLGKNGKTTTVRLNRLVCEAFHGSQPTPAHEAAHKDGDRSNNRSDNLYWATKMQNAADKQRHGTTARGAMFKSSKLSPQAVCEIRAAVQNGTSQKALAAQFGVSDSLIWAVVHGRIWKWAADHRAA